MGLKFLFYKILNLGEDNTKDIDKLGLLYDDIKILNLVNYYSLFFYLSMYFKLVQINSKNEYIFLFTFIASILYIFMIVSGNLRNTFYLILATPILSVILYNTFIYNVLNSVTSSLIVGIGLLYIFFIVYFFRRKELIVVFFLMLSIFILLFATTVFNLLINNSQINIKENPLSNNISSISQENSLLDINHILSFYLSLGVLFIYYINVRTVKNFAIPLIVRIKKNMKNIKNMKVNEKKIKDNIKRNNENIFHLNIHKSENEAFRKLNSIRFQDQRIEEISVIVQQYLKNCILFAIYQREHHNTLYFNSLVLFSNAIKQKNRSVNLKNSLYEDVIKLKRKITVKDMPLKFFSHSRNIIRTPVCLYLFPIIYNKNIYEILEFCVEKELTLEEEKKLTKMLSYLSCTLENNRLAKEYKSLKSTLSEVLVAVNNKKEKKMEQQYFHT